MTATTTTTTDRRAVSAGPVVPVQDRLAHHVLNALAETIGVTDTDALADEFADAIDACFDHAENAERAAQRRRRAARAARRSWTGASDRPTNARQQRA